MKEMSKKFRKEVREPKRWRGEDVHKTHTKSRPSYRREIIVLKEKNWVQSVLTGIEMEIDPKHDGSNKRGGLNLNYYRNILNPDPL